MTNKFLLYQLIGLLILTISCHSDRYRDELEKRVLNQVFKELTDSLIYYQSFPPPPPPPEVDYSGNIVDTSNIVLYRKLVARIDTSKKVIAMSDSTRLDEHFKEWIDLYQPYFDTLGFRHKIEELIKTKIEVTKIDTSQILNTGRYELMNLSNINKIQTKHPFLEYYFVYYGNMTLSRIYFDKSHDKGFFTCEITGSFFHYSYLIFIKTGPSKWVITRMKRLSIA
jgi:hypothetical protein